MHILEIYSRNIFLIRNILRITTKTSNFIVLKRTLSLKNTFLYLAYNKSKNVFFLPKKGLSVTKHIVFKMCFEIFNLQVQKCYYQSTIVTILPVSGDNRQHFD